MRRGHCYGTRKVSRKAQAWYDSVQDEHLTCIPHIVVRVNVAVWSH
jgi:hypothetical protein